MLSNFKMILLSTVFINAAMAGNNGGLPKSLKDAISTAVKNNPKTVSTNELLEAIHYQTLASKMNQYPSGYANCSSNYTYATSSFGEPSRNTSNSCALTVSATLFDGGAGHYRYLSDVAAEAATIAAYNTSDSMISNTRGGLANKAMGNFVDVVDTSDGIKYSTQALSFLHTFQKVSDDYLLKSAINEIEQNINQLNDQLKLLKESFEYVVTLPPASELESLDTTIGQLKIPQTSEDAIALALENGPEVVRRNLNVQMAEYNLKALKASLGPSVSVSVSTGATNSKDHINPINNYNGNNSSIGISVSIPFDLSGKYRFKAAESSLASKKSEREAAIADAKYSVSAQYKRLSNLKNNYIVQSKNYSDQLNYLQNLAADVESGKVTNLDITKTLSALSTLDRRFSQLQRTQIEILYNLFSIQQVTGQLFLNFVGE